MINDAAVARIINDLAHWHVHAPAASDVLATIDLHRSLTRSPEDG